MAYFRCGGAPKERIKWIIKEGIEQVGRTLSNGLQTSVYHEEGYREYISNTSQNLVLAWNADCAEYTRLHIKAFTTVALNNIQLGRTTNLVNVIDIVSIPYGGNFSDPRTGNTTFTITTPTEINNPAIYLGTHGAVNLKLCIIDMWLE